MSSWGEKGYSNTWLDGSNDWVYRHLHHCAELMVALARDFDDVDALHARALNQAARELLLAQASDWAFIMKTAHGRLRGAADQGTHPAVLAPSRAASRRSNRRPVARLRRVEEQSVSRNRLPRLPSVGVSAKTNKRKVAALLDQAKLYLSLGQPEKAEAALAEVAHDSDFGTGLFFALLADAQDRPGRLSQVLATLEEGLARYPGEADLEVRMGHALMRQDKLELGLAYFDRARPKLRRDVNFLTQYAFALIRGGRLDEAEACLGDAVAGGGGLGARLVLAVARGQRGRYAEALELASAVEKAGKTGELVSAARSVKADCMLFLGDAAGALRVWKELREAGTLEDAQFGHMAYAAQLAGEPSLCDELIRLRVERGPTAEDLLLFAQVANLRSKPGEALVHLTASDQAGGERHPGHGFEVLSTRGRALRLLGRRDEAREALTQARALPEFQSARLGPKVCVDLGHLYAEEGDFERADQQFREALAADPQDPKRCTGCRSRRGGSRGETRWPPLPRRRSKRRRPRPKRSSGASLRAKASSRPCGARSSA